MPSQKKTAKWQEPEGKGRGGKGITRATHLVRRELELIPGQRVAQAEAHRAEVVLAHRGKEAVHLPPDAAHQLHHPRIVHALDRQLLLDGVRQLRVGNRQLGNEIAQKNVAEGGSGRGTGREGGREEGEPRRKEKRDWVAGG